MRLRLDIALALFLMLHSTCSVSLEDAQEYGAGLNHGSDYNTEVPMVGGNDVGGLENDLGLGDNSEGQMAKGSMIFSGAEDPEPSSFPNPLLRDGETDDLSGSSGSSETNGTIDSPLIMSNDYPEENHTMARNDTTKSPESPLQDPPKNETVSTSSDIVLNTTTNSTAQANDTVITDTEPNNTTVVTSPEPATNGSDVLLKPTEGSRKNEGTSTTSTANDTKGGPEPPTESLPSDKTTSTTTRTPEEIPVDDTTTAWPEVPLEPTTTTAGPDATAGGKAAAAAGGDNSERGLSSETENKRNGKAWGVVLGIAVTVGFVGLVVYVLLKRRGQRNFSHSKLVEDGHPDPVLRLDNGEPLDLKFDGNGYYNPSLQGDNIQMANFPAGNYR